MRAEQLWFLLSDLARQMDIQVRLEHLEQPELNCGSGGVCRLRGRSIIFIDKRLPVNGRLRQLGLCLLGQDVEKFHMLPALRCFLQKLEKESGPGN